MIEMSKDYEISDEQLLIKTAIPFLSLSKMEIYHDVNAHASVRISVIIKEEDQFRRTHEQYKLWKSDFGKQDRY